jgi:hypothetical protein
MRKSSIALLLLSTGLVASNAWWLYNTIDFGVTHTYAMQTCSEDAEALDQALAMLPVAAQSGASRASIIAAARRGKDQVEFEKDGYTWVGRLGLRFDADGRLVEVAR